MKRLGEIDPFRGWAREINSILRTSRTLADAAAEHGGMIGETREFFVREILRRLLPASVTVGTGQIIDSQSQLSKQIDVVIYRSDFPVLTSLAVSDVYFVEGVIATIEVKSTLEGKLEDALDNSQSVKELTLATATGGESFKARRAGLPATYIFGYKWYKERLDCLRGALHSWIEGRKPSILELPDVIVTQGCVVMTNYGSSSRAVFDVNAVRRCVTHNASDASTCVFLARRDDEALTWLLVHLLTRILKAGGVPNYISGVRYATTAVREKEWELWGTWCKSNPGELDMAFDSRYLPGSV